MRTAPNFKDLTGLKINMWTVLKRSVGRVEKGKAFWDCRCDCGTLRAVAACNLITRSTKSCGCLKKTAEWKSSHKPSGLKHGMTGSKEYRAWRAMINRCENPNVESYKHYGARGISVCDKWRNSFEEFFKDVGACPIGKNSIGRIDSSRNYEHGNVRWEDVVEQNNNKSDTRKVSLFGKTLSVAKWCAELGLKKNAVYSRLASGWDCEKALLTPIREKRQHACKI